MSVIAEAIAFPQRNELALADERVRYNWAELDELLNRAVNALRVLDSGPDKRVAIFAANSADTVLAYVAAIHAGLSSVPVNFHLTVDELVYILKDSGAKILLVGPETVERGMEAARLAGLETIVAWRTPAQDGVLDWASLLAKADGAAIPDDIRPLPHLHYTSGSTGTPKGVETPAVMFPQVDSVTEWAAILRQRVAAQPKGPSVAAGPLYHTGPLNMTRQLLVGTAVVSMDRFDPEALLAIIEKEKIVSAVLVPTHFQRLLSLPEDVRARYDLSSLGRIVHTGAACPRDVKKQMIDWFGPVLSEAYGGTESGTLAVISSQDWLERQGSVGRAVAPFSAVIIGENGQELGPNESGQLYFRDATGRGIIFHNDPEKTKAAHIAPGVFTLGEVGHVDEDGYIYVTDRVSDMIVSGGVNIYPAEAEKILIQHPQVADVVVIGAPNIEMGEEVKALIVAVDPDNLPDPDLLNRHCREHLAGYKCPRSYDFVADVGRNALGKVNKRQLKAHYWPSDRTIGG